MIYLSDNKQYHLSYSELKDAYFTYKNMSNAEFFKDIPKLLHLICIICYMKEVPSDILLIDDGLIHQLVHLLDNETAQDPIINNDVVFASIRNNFDKICNLN